MFFGCKGMMHHTVRNLHFLSKNSTLISRENCRFLFGWKTRKNVVVWDFLAADNFDFTRKIVQKFEWKNRQNVGVLSKLNFWTKIWLVWCTYQGSYCCWRFYRWFFVSAVIIDWNWRPCRFVENGTFGQGQQACWCGFDFMETVRDFFFFSFDSTIHFCFVLPTI